MYRRKLAVLAGTAAIMGVVAAPAQADAVCNEAEASWQDGYTVTGPPDPNPPARLYGGPGEAMALAGGEVNSGLAHAAEQSPALATCAPTSDGGGDGGGDGGDGGGIT